jgi:AMP-polyphosphate phosphotransferase
MHGQLSELDLSKQIDEKSDYRQKVQELQLQMLHFQRQILESNRPVIFVFEGPDAAGKGGVIKRITEKLDPRLLRVYAIVKPSQ